MYDSIEVTSEGTQVDGERQAAAAKAAVMIALIHSRSRRRMMAGANGSNGQQQQQQPVTDIIGSEVSQIEFSCGT